MNSATSYSESQLVVVDESLDKLLNPSELQVFICKMEKMVQSGGS